MNLDRTFCSGLRCSRANTCERWTENLKRWIEQQPENRRKRFTERPISLAQFADHAGNCDKYDPIENVEPSLTSEGLESRVRGMPEKIRFEPALEKLMKDGGFKRWEIRWDNNSHIVTVLASSKPSKQFLSEFQGLLQQGWNAEGDLLPLNVKEGL